MLDQGTSGQVLDRGEQVPGEGQQVLYQLGLGRIMLLLLGLGSHVQVRLESYVQVRLGDLDLMTFVSCKVGMESLV